MDLTWKERLFKDSIKVPIKPLRISNIHPKSALGKSDEYIKAPQDAYLKRR